MKKKLSGCLKDQMRISTSSQNKTSRHPDLRRTDRGAIDLIEVCAISDQLYLDGPNDATCRSITPVPAVQAPVFGCI